MRIQVPISRVCLLFFTNPTPPFQSAPRQPGSNYNNNGRRSNNNYNNSRGGKRGGGGGGNSRRGYGGKGGGGDCGTVAGAVTQADEVGSIFKPGGKKQNWNHLLNFNYGSSAASRWGRARPVYFVFR